MSVTAQDLVQKLSWLDGVQLLALNLELDRFASEFKVSTSWMKDHSPACNLGIVTMVIVTTTAGISPVDTMGSLHRAGGSSTLESQLARLKQLRR